MIVELQEHGGWIPIGQIRIDHEGVVSISLSSPYRGRYLAEPALRKAISYHSTCFPRQTLTAYVKPDNELSQKIFIRVGFKFAGKSQVHSQPCLKYIYYLPGDQDDDSSGKGDRLVQDS
jgi:RimJ/RimL family protein N-acetyltransferase